jgi:hypothetical protein
MRARVVTDGFADHQQMHGHATAALGLAEDELREFDAPRGL